MSLKFRFNPSNKKQPVRPIILAAPLLFFVIISALGQSANHLTMDELRQLRLPDVALEDVTHSDQSHYVQVKGTIGSAIRFELLLPDDWNGRFVMGGGGGFVGTVQNGARDSVNHGYATVGTDTGPRIAEPAYTAGVGARQSRGAS